MPQRRTGKSPGSNLFFLMLIGHAIAHPGVATITLAPPNNAQIRLNSHETVLQNAEGGIENAEAATTGTPFWKREADSAIPSGFEGFVAQGSVCGFNPTVTPQFCLKTETCVVTATSGQPSAIRGCCHSSSCSYFTHSACSDSSMYSNACGTDHKCSAGVGVCTNSAQPHCYSYSILGPWGAVSAWGCLETQPSSVVTYTTGTLSNWQALGITAATSAGSITELPSKTASGTNTAASQTSGSPTAVSKASSPPTPIGKIIGGIVVAVAVLGIIVGGFYFLRKKYGTKGLKRGGGVKRGGRFKKRATFSQFSSESPLPQRSYHQLQDVSKPPGDGYQYVSLEPPTGGGANLPR